MFLLNHSLWWRRGLGGPTGYLVSSSPYNVGPALGVSPSATFAAMLGSTMKCSFSMNLYVNVKSNNGFGTLDSRMTEITQPSPSKMTLISADQELCHIHYFEYMA